MMTLFRTSSCVLVIILLQLVVVSSFQLLNTKTRTNNHFSNSPIRIVESLNKSTVILKATTSQEENKAVDDFKMITEDESKLRKIGGVIIGIATIATYFTQGDHSYSSLSAGAFAAISTYRTGSEYQ